MGNQTSKVTSTKKISFGDKKIGSGEPTLIIAEIGINHEGNSDICIEMIKAAAKAGADSIKLQTIDPDANYVRGTESHSIFTKSKLSKDETAEMFQLSRQLGLEPFTTAGDFATIDWVDQLEPAAHKISSGLFTNIPIIGYTAEKNRPLLMSTGMASYNEIDEAVQEAKSKQNDQIGLFQCTSRYPAPNNSLNLSTIIALEMKYGLPAGFSDHSVGTEAAFLSIGAGAKMIEKHFTFDTSREGFDHKLSLDYKNFSAMVKRIRQAEEMLGSPSKHVDSWEAEAGARMHRIIVAISQIKAGEKLSINNIGLKRPLNPDGGLAPKHFYKIIGRTVKSDINFDETITNNHLSEPI